jgi:hypothetical protein
VIGRTGCTSISISPSLPDGARLPYLERREPVRAKAAELADAGDRVLLTVEEPEHEHFHITMTHPEGNVFCLR